MKEPQHDEHCNRFDEHLWKDWPPEEVTPVGINGPMADDAGKESALVARVVDDIEPLSFYVISKSDSVENLYWTADGWAPFTAATSKFSRTHVVKCPEPRDGFWMPLERAEELEQ